MIFRVSLSRIGEHQSKKRLKQKEQDWWSGRQWIVCDDQAKQLISRLSEHSWRHSQRCFLLHSATSFDQTLSANTLSAGKGVRNTPELRHDRTGLLNKWVQARSCSLGSKPLSRSDAIAKLIGKSRAAATTASLWGLRQRWRCLWSQWPEFVRRPSSRKRTSLKIAPRWWHRDATKTTAVRQRFRGLQWRHNRLWFATEPPQLFHWNRWRHPRSVTSQRFRRKRARNTSPSPRSPRSHPWPGGTIPGSCTRTKATSPFASVLPTSPPWHSHRRSEDRDSSFRAVLRFSRNLEALLGGVWSKSRPVSWWFCEGTHGAQCTATGRMWCSRSTWTTVTNILWMEKLRL